MVYDILEKYRDEVTPTKERGDAEKARIHAMLKAGSLLHTVNTVRKIGGVSFDIGMKSFSRVLQREN